MHLNSRVHKGDQIGCPFCEKGFTAATGLTHHLEKGSCPNAPGLSRDKVYEIVRSRDPQGAISKNLLGWYGSVEYAATERSWNGDAYECYICHREFNQLNSLNQHLSSPTHQQSLYHCPNTACRMDFKNLAAMINHLESESCGFMRFDAVQRTMGNLISSNRLLSF
ncbi:unnamed protein product [Parascedosporium putredinis]|uniref:C2H2-type domain-containing protein n=1 Tax=Parascedosporium putredinis TaxID=1442378 RepID=A0A9P1GVC2_9PEZI|nr:unnamed protein product [Parascedosporium putredinis]CAI7988359.1 unnamed protein product [Parascedosporium putredinis]